MIQNLDVPKEICTNQVELLSIPIDGRWEWDEKKKELVYQSYYDSGRIREKNNQEKNLKTKEKLKIDIRTGFIHYRKQNRRFEQILKTTKDENTITLEDVIQASLNVMSELFYIPIEFEEYLRMPPVQEFLLYLLNYFYWFFETMNNATPKPGKQIDRSEREKDRIRVSYAHLLAALRELGCKYSALLLGINLKNYHHMRNGDLFYSCDDVDRTIYESLFIFSTYFVWITFYRQNFDSIQIELARLFRAGGDMDVLRIPSTERLEGRMNTDETLDFSHQHKLIDCRELFSESLAKKAASDRNSRAYQSKTSVDRISSVLSNLNLVAEESDTEQKPYQSKSRLRSFLARDFHESEDNSDQYTYELGEESPYYYQRHKLFLSQRRNRIRGILTKQLRKRNQSLLEERHRKPKKEVKVDERFSKEERERQTRHRLLKSVSLASYKNISLLPIPYNPLDKSRNERSILPEIQFRVIFNIGIIGKSSLDFDSIRLILKPPIKDDIVMPDEFLL